MMIPPNSPFTLFELGSLESLVAFWHYMPLMWAAMSHADRMRVRGVLASSADVVTKCRQLFGIFMGVDRLVPITPPVN